MTFDNFVQACVTVKTLTDSFRAFDTDGDGWININYEQVMIIMMIYIKKNRHGKIFLILTIFIFIFKIVLGTRYSPKSIDVFN